MQNRVVTDTGMLWSVDASVRPDYDDKLHIECLLRLVDSAIHPERSLSCLIPSLRQGEGDHSHLPETFRAFKAAQLITIERSVDPHDRLPTKKHLHALSSVLTRWYRNDTAYAQGYLDLHLNGRVRGGWADRVPTEGVPVNWHGVPLHIYAYYTENTARFATLRSLSGWSDWQTAFLFSIVARGAQYGIAAHVFDAKYLTHPIRWLGMAHRAKPSAAEQPTHLPLASILYLVWKRGAHAHDLKFLADKAAEIRAAAEHDTLYLDLLRNPGSKSAAEDRLKELLKGVLPGRLSAEATTALRRMADTIAAVGPALTTGTTGDAFAAAWTLLAQWAMHGWIKDLESADISPRFRDTPILRDHIRYSHLIELSHESCPRCGSILRGVRCSVCIGLTEASDFDAEP